jgi:quinol monooxygenase YgiN
MIIEYIRYKIAPEQRQAFIQAYVQAAVQLDDSKFCLGYELAECEEEQEQFILRIEWTSTDDHLNGFRKSSDFPIFFAHVRPYFNNIEEMHHYTLTQVVRKALYL